jgi:SAM-dependent methyltransferase
VGADPWLAALERAGEKRHRWPVANADLARADGAALPFREGAFDLAVSNLGLNNFADQDAALAECRRVLMPGGTLALTTNLTGHWREFYAAFAAALAERGDRAALARLAHHVAHRGTIESLTRRLERAGFRVTGSYEHVVPMRFADSEALFSHHFIRLGFVPAWENVIEEPARAEVFVALRARLDGIAREHGELKLTVPFACVVAARG